MIPVVVRFTDLEFDPLMLQDRCIKGVIPPEWQRHHFVLDNQAATYPVNQLNRWLRANIKGCWAIYIGYTGNQRTISLAFEHNHDAMTFVMADGKTEAFKDSND